MEKQNPPTNETPIAKKKWETPQLIFICSGDVQSGVYTGLREGSFHATPSGYSVPGVGSGYNLGTKNAFHS
jgi:hypothetical protein